jgi:CDP-diacylglycerol--glycerol-3-phosphate 3-phosphatidyltransferase
MIDGTIARKTISNSEFGAIFDTVSDFLFVVVSLIKFLPLIHIPIWLWIWLVIIAIIKIGNIIYGYATKKHFIPPHTVMNKITGLILFLLPLTLSFVELKYSSVLVCLVATFSAIQEWTFIAKKQNLE